MAGYIGSKAVLLSTTAATVTGGADIAGDLTVDTNTLFVDSTNNRVGVGTASPSQLLHISSTGNSFVRLDGGAASTTGLLFDNADGAVYYDASSNYMRVDTAGSERMRIDSSGNVLVGKTATGLNTEGIEIRADNAAYFTKASNTVVFMNRKTTDGDILQFRKDNTTVGSITSRVGVVSSIILDPRAGGTGLSGGTAQILPTDISGNVTDNIADLGASTVRWDDIYATNGTIQTSDANEKQQIAELTTAEMQAAKAISKLFKTFKWNDSVAEKGDAARIHSGVIAQEVEAAMTAAGLDAGKYAFFISSTWWESTEVIPAVEAVEAVEATYDEEGNILTEAVEAVEAQPERTVTHTHETAEEAPEGAVERTRKGIRYPQLLSFIGAATEQRLASIEARLDALEAN